MTLSNGSIATAWDRKATIYAKSIEINLPENNKDVIAGSELNLFIRQTSTNQFLVSFGGNDTLVGSNGSDILMAVQVMITSKLGQAMTQ